MGFGFVAPPPSNNNKTTTTTVDATESSTPLQRQHRHHQSGNRCEGDSLGSVNNIVCEGPVPGEEEEEEEEGAPLKNVCTPAHPNNSDSVYTERRRRVVTRAAAAAGPFLYTTPSLKNASKPPSELFSFHHNNGGDDGDYTDESKGGRDHLARVPSDETQHNISKNNINSTNTTTSSTSPPSTPFRFCSFPASLPRVQPQSISNNEQRKITTNNLFPDDKDNNKFACGATATDQFMSDDDEDNNRFHFRSIEGRDLFSSRSNSDEGPSCTPLRPKATTPSKSTSTPNRDTTFILTSTGEESSSFKNIMRALPTPTFTPGVGVFRPTLNNNNNSSPNKGSHAHSTRHYNTRSRSGAGSASALDTSHDTSISSISAHSPQSFQSMKNISNQGTEEEEERMIQRMIASPHHNHAKRSTSLISANDEYSHHAAAIDFDLSTDNDSSQHSPCSKRIGVGTKLNFNALSPCLDSNTSQPEICTPIEEIKPVNSNDLTEVYEVSSRIGSFPSVFSQNFTVDLMEGSTTNEKTTQTIRKKRNFPSQHNYHHSQQFSSSSNNNDDDGDEKMDGGLMTTSTSSRERQHDEFTSSKLEFTQCSPIQQYSDGSACSACSPPSAPSHHRNRDNSMVIDDEKEQEPSWLLRGTTTKGGGEDDSSIPPSLILPNHQQQNDHHVHFSSNTSKDNDESGYSTLSSKFRKLRPMPDMSAFEGGSSARNSSFRRSSLGVSNTNTGCGANISRESGSNYNNSSFSYGGTSSHHHHQSPFKVACPPTPIRTPAWVHNDTLHCFTPSFNRSYHNSSANSISFNNCNSISKQDSLISTKILAACPPELLDGFSSFENSLGDDNYHPTNNNEQAAVSNSLTLEGNTTTGGTSTTSPAHGLFPRLPAVPPHRQHQTSFTSGVSVNESINSGTGQQQQRTATASGSSSFLKREPLFTPPTPPYRSSSMVKRPYPINNSNKIQTLRDSSISYSEIGSIISFDTDFENLGQIGSGHFADVFKVRSKKQGVGVQDSNSKGCLYAIKRNRRQFRGKRDREQALTEVRNMQRLQLAVKSRTTTTKHQNEEERSTSNTNTFCPYLLLFIRAWQEDGHFFSQTELCCRDNCRNMILSLRSEWPIASKKYPSLLRNLPPISSSSSMENGEDDCCRLLPESTIWRICHDIVSGLAHIHSHNMVHNDIKPSNIFFAAHNRIGCICKIGDFGLACDSGSTEDGHEGDTKYMPQELLSSNARLMPSADIFSFGLTLYELSANDTFELPAEGPRWHDIRSGKHKPEIPNQRCDKLKNIVQNMINLDPSKRCSARDILDLQKVKEAGNSFEKFLAEYVHDVAVNDLEIERELAVAQKEAALGRYTPTSKTVGISL